MSPRNDLRECVLRAIARNRAPGYHFPGHFLGLRWSEVESDHANLVLPDTAHFHDARGDVHFLALAVLVDVALGMVVRLEDRYQQRQATVYLQLQLTGVPARGELCTRASARGSSVGSRVGYSFGEATVEANGGIVGRASGTFARIDSPPGVTLGPLPWERAGAPPALPDEATLDASERQILERCDRALACAGAGAPFIERFWGPDPPFHGVGESAPIVIGPHIANRVGHVHGGILLGLAVLAAGHAAPANMRLSNASVWYLRPGLAEPLVVTPTLAHKGNTTAVVVTDVKSADSGAVIKAVTQHVAV